MDEAILIRALKALADKKRMRMAREIACAGELSCGQVKSHFKLSQTTISHHLKILADAGVITVREAGQHRFSRAAPALILELAAVLPGSVDNAASPVRGGSKTAKKKRHS